MTSYTSFHSRPRMLCLIGIGLLSGTFAMMGLECPAAPVIPGGGGDDGGPGTGNSGVTGKYVGSERCSQCHARAHEAWGQTLHAKALSTLEKIGQGSNAACLGCHTIGFGEEGGFVNRATTNVLANVGCESCHGPGRDHVTNVNVVELRPPKSISADVCGKCHTGSHHPTFEQWSESGKALVTDGVWQSFAGGNNLNNCGTCHSGDFRYLAVYNNETVQNDYLKNKTREEMHGITCVICHDPHNRTGNAAFPEEGRDYQLRFRQVLDPVPSNTVEDATNKERFNLCGQCHHSRGRTWADTARGPHHSVQANVYIGEMPVPVDTPPLVLSMNSPHRLVREQCSTCHMYRKDFESEVAPAISGHDFKVNYEGCTGAGCHPSGANALALKQTLENNVKTRLDGIKNRLGDPATWEYTSNGGPNNAGQAALPEAIKKIRFLYHYTISDGSYGMHNPAYVKAMLTRAEDLLTAEGL